MTQNEGCQEQENQRENNSTLQREAVCAQHAKEVSRRISVYHLCFCNVSVDVFHSPAANLTIVTKDDEACQNAETACKAPFLADGAEGTECIFVCVVEDTPTTLDDLKAAFGEEVALLVDGVTKLTKIQFSNIEELQAENLRKMLLAMSQDVRVMIIKLCDRLHNMRTGDAWPEQKRRDKARETMEVYAPIANRLGILNVKEELEDRSLHYLDPVGYSEISRMLSERAGEEFLIKVSGVIERRLVESGIEGATIKRYKLSDNQWLGLLNGNDEFICVVNVLVINGFEKNK